MVANLAGQQFGLLVARSLAWIASVGRHAMWRCECRCGKNTVVRSGHLINGATKSCGCLHGRIVHGHSRRMKTSRTYKTWDSMKLRCLNSKFKAYSYYGGRGVKICDSWLKFDNFLSDMGERPEGTSLDRINNDGNYEPSNCRWATPKEQAQNRRPRRW